MLKCYGENSFTFLLLRALAEHDHVKDILLASLRRIRDSRPLSLDPHGDPDVYLFPNFGKSSGFGEPDVLALVGDYSFWFEVETRVDCTKSFATFDRALLQLFRFSVLAHTISRGCQVRIGKGPDHLAYMSATLGDGMRPRFAVLRLAGHKILSEMRDQVANSFNEGKDYYVLLTEKEPSGIAKPKTRRHIGPKIAEFHANLAAWCRKNGPSPPRQPAIDRFAYVYWAGSYGIRGKVTEEIGDPLRDGGYVSIKSSSR